MVDVKKYPGFDEFLIDKPDGGTMRIDLLVRRYIAHPETVLLLTASKLLQIRNLGERRLEVIQLVLERYGLSILPSNAAFAERYMYIYGPDITEDTPVEAIELAAARHIYNHTPSQRTVREAHGMMRESSNGFYELAAAVGIKPSEGPLCQNGLFIFDKSQRLWDYVTPAVKEVRSTSTYS